MSEQSKIVEAPESYPTTRPAMRIKVTFTDRHNCGDIHTGSTLVTVPLLSGGIVESVGDFEPKFKFTVAHSADYFAVDADKLHGRMDFQGTLVDDEGRSARVIGDGVVELNNEIMSLVYNQPDARTVAFGHSIQTFKFQTGHPEYKTLEAMKFAGSQRFIYVDGVQTGVEIRISQILSGTGMD